MFISLSIIRAKLHTLYVVYCSNCSNTICPWLWFIDEQNTCLVWSARCRDEGGHLNVLDSNSRTLV